MHLSLVLCAKDRASSLGDTLRALSVVPPPEGAQVEIIVVDNGSAAPLKPLVESITIPYATVRCLAEPKRGKANALNLALQVARGEILVFLDDDVRPQATWLRAIVAPIADGRYDGLSGAVQLAPELTRPWMKQIHRSWLASTDYLDQTNPATAVGANMAFSRAVFNRIPRFDPELGPGKLGLWEDTLFALQVKQAGFKLGFAAEAKVIHHFEANRLTRAAFVSRALAEGRSSAYVAWHWQHVHPTRSLQREATWHLHLMAKRWTRRSEWRSPEGMPVWEMNLLSGIAFEKQLRREALNTRAYSHLGLRKSAAQSGVA